MVNDTSDRKFTPNPERKTRERDKFFDWLHGKWHDSFCPVGPCVTSADAITDPQRLAVRLTGNGDRKQDGNTGQMIFPVAAVVAFVSRWVRLEPGDLISTGTPSGVGSSTGTYLIRFPGRKFGLQRAKSKSPIKNLYCLAICNPRCARTSWEPDQTGG